MLMLMLMLVLLLSLSLTLPGSCCCFPERHPLHRGLHRQQLLLQQTPWPLAAAAPARAAARQTMASIWGLHPSISA